MEDHDSLAGGGHCPISCPKRLIRNTKDAENFPKGRTCIKVKLKCDIQSWPDRPSRQRAGPRDQGREVTVAVEGSIQASVQEAGL